MVAIPNMKCPKSLIDHLSVRYNYWCLDDTTVNIHQGTICSHATGISERVGEECNLTAGIHVHFSRHLDGKRVQLPIEKIVKRMDRMFEMEIKASGRIFGEYEIKTHGFEYRSLPTDTSIDKVIKESFKIFKG